MGLHAHITQRGREAEIRIIGEMTSHSIAQVQAIIEHFRARGCDQISVSASQRQLSALDQAQNEVLAQARELTTEIAIRRQ
ncbi:hypothetical protein IT157_06010 [bacterium]|jgi:deoxyadenosine/deoxycytidine kinase|nr:hypothetical protein [bacterium]